MGTDKATLDLGGVPAWQRSVSRLSGFASEVWLAPGTPGRLGPTGLHEVKDDGSGPGSAIAAALTVCRTDLMAVVAVDMPFASPAVLEHLAGEIGPAPGAVPCCGSRPQPLHAVYRTSACDQMTSLLATGERSITKIAKALGCRFMTAEALKENDPKGLFCLNVNSPENLLEAVALIGTGL
jgi:molybdopterin-guanine dinucleotide biosynthesis protein A